MADRRPSYSNFRYSKGTYVENRCYELPAISHKLLCIQSFELLQPLPHRVASTVRFGFHTFQYLPGGWVAMGTVHVLVLTGLLHRYAQVHKLVDPVLYIYM